MLSVTKLWADHCSSLLRENKTAKGNQPLLPLPSETIDRGALDTVLSGAKNRFQLLGLFIQTQVSALQHLVGIDGHRTTSEDEAQLGDNAESTVGPARSHNDFPESDTRPSIFHMPQPKYTNLRKELASAHNATDVSGNHIICAFIWKSILRAWAVVRAQQKSDLGEIATLAIPFDARPDLSHLLPVNYLGNLYFEHVSDISRDDDSIGSSDDSH